MIKSKKNLYITIILIGMFSVVAAEIRLDNIDSIKNWSIIQKKVIQIRWTDYEGYPICQTTSVLPFSMESISSIIEDVENYPSVFKRILKTNTLEKDIVHVMLDMPLFLSNRDYVIQYIKSKNQNTWEFTFNAVKHIDAPEKNNYVRLVNAAGKWKLVPKNKNETTVSYTWNGELLGDFPSFALERAWKTQGNEIIHWLNDALE
tara:strand:+ start:694 stop:1305 length:612 start_codon:yes stop_codon:yes gene_type:complete